MTDLHLYLDPWMLQAVKDGRRSMPGAVRRVGRGRQAGPSPFTPKQDRHQIGRSGGYHMVVNQPVDHPQTLTLRIAGWEPFWRIEPTNDRWDWDVAGLPFTPEKIGGP